MQYGDIGIFLSSQAMILDHRREKDTGATQNSLAEEGRIRLNREGVACRVLAVNSNGVEVEVVEGVEPGRHGMGEPV
jgi:hypothetical protein